MVVELALIVSLTNIALALAVWGVKALPTDNMSLTSIAVGGVLFVGAAFVAGYTQALVPAGLELPVLLVSLPATAYATKYLLQA